MLKIKDLVKKIEDGVKIEDLGIEVKKRIPIAKKIVEIEGYDHEGFKFVGMARACVKVEAGLMKILYGIKEIIFVQSVISNYTNIETEDEEYLYDLVLETGIYDYVINRIDFSDFAAFRDMFNDTVNQTVQNYNSLSSFLNRIFNKLLNKIPSSKEMEKIIKEVSKIDKNKINELKEIITKYKH